MKINVADSAKLQAALNYVEGRATARTVSVKRVQDLAVSAEHTLSALPRALVVGAEVDYCQYIGCNSYARKAYYASSTRVLLRRGARSWYLVSASRDSISPSKKGPSAVVRLRADAESPAAAAALRLLLAGLPTETAPSEAWEARKLTTDLAALLEVDAKQVPHVLRELVRAARGGSPLQLLAAASPKLRDVGLRVASTQGAVG